MKAPARYGLALVLLPVFVLTVAGWLAWRIVKLAGLAVVNIPNMLAWALRAMILALMIGGLLVLIVGLAKYVLDV